MEGLVKDERGGVACGIVGMIEGGERGHRGGERGNERSKLSRLYTVTRFRNYFYLGFASNGYITEDSIV